MGGGEGYLCAEAGPGEVPGAGAAPPALPAAPQLSLGWSWGAGERSHKWFLSAAEEFRPGSGAAGGGAGWQEKRPGCRGSAGAGEKGEGSGAPWCRRRAPREAVLVPPSPSASASARVGIPLSSPAASPLRQLRGTAPGRAAQYGIRLTPAGATEPGAAPSPPG